MYALRVPRQPPIHLNANRALPTVFMNVDRYRGQRKKFLDHHDKAVWYRSRISILQHLAMHANTTKSKRSKKTKGTKVKLQSRNMSKKEKVRPPPTPFTGVLPHKLPARPAHRSNSPLWRLHIGSTTCAQSHSNHQSWVLDQHCSVHLAGPPTHLV